MIGEFSKLDRQAEASPTFPRAGRGRWAGSCHPRTSPDTGDETQRRRRIQIEYNRKYGIVPETIRKEVKTILASPIQKPDNIIAQRLNANDRSRHELSAIIAGLEEEMFESARKLEFEKAAMIRDQIRILQSGEKA